MECQEEKLNEGISGKSGSTDLPKDKSLVLRLGFGSRDRGGV